MKLTSTHVSQAPNQIRAEAVPESFPAVEQFIRVFGDHTFFIDEEGLSIVEPLGSAAAEGESMEATRLVRLAHWRDDDHSSLVPHTPQRTDTVVMLSSAA